MHILLNKNNIISCLLLACGDFLKLKNGESGKKIKRDRKGEENYIKNGKKALKMHLQVRVIKQGFICVIRLCGAYLTPY